MYHTVKKFALFLVIITAMQSCTIVRSLHEMRKKHASVGTINYNDKSIKYIPMHHLGKKVFYDDVTRKIAYYKKDGYKVYFELVKFKPLPDSTANDLLKRKARKLKGFSGTYKDMANESGTFKKYIQQPSYASMGVDSTDVWADMDYASVIAVYEHKYGPIMLDSVDMHTPLKARYESNKITRKQWNKVAVGARNEHLAGVIKHSQDKKILIIYGKGHMKGVKRILKEK